RSTMSFERGLRRLQALGHAADFLFSRKPAFVRLSDVSEGLGVPCIQFAQSFLVEMDAAFVALDLAANLRPLLLRFTDLPLQFCQGGAQLKDLLFCAEHAFRTSFDLAAVLVGERLLFSDLRLEKVELMPRKLCIQMLQFLHDLFVAARFARLPLQRSDLPL